MLAHAVDLDRTDEVGHDPFRALHDGGLLHPAVAAQHGFDLTELDPEPPHLDLVVDPAEELQLAAGGPPAQVPRPVHAAAGRAERIGQETRGSQATPVEVAAGHQLARDVELAAHTGRHRPQRPVQHVHPGVPDRPADGQDPRAVRCPGWDDQFRAAHGGLRGAVLVDHGDAGVGGPPLPQLLARQGLAAQDQLPAGRVLGGQGAQQRQVAGCGLDEAGPVHRLGALGEVHQVHAPAGGQRAEQAGGREVKGDR